MKKLFQLALAYAFVSLIFTGCPSGASDDGPDVVPGTIGNAASELIAAQEAAKNESDDDIILYYYRKDSDYSSWALWAWETVANNGQAGYDATVGKVKTVTKNGKTIAYWNLSELVPDLIKDVKKSDDKFNFLIRDDNWNKDPGTDQTIDLSYMKKSMVLSGDAAVYDITNDISPAISAAISISSDSIKVSLSVSLGLEITASDNKFVLKDEDGNVVQISDVLNFESQHNRNRNNAKTVLLKLSEKLDGKKSYFISREGFEPSSGFAVMLQNAIKDSPTYDGTDLGLTLDGNKATFKSWAPVASDVKLLVYSSAADVGNFNDTAVSNATVGSLDDETLLGNPAQTIQMTKDAASGVWSAEIQDVSSYKYYKYQIVNMGKTYYVSDIWGKSCSADAIASQITDINDTSSGAVPSSSTDMSYGTKSGYYNPFGNSGEETKSYTDAVVYEMHITDWSYAENPEATENVGKYLTIANGDKVINHIKELGVTHVQILPVFEFAETNANTKYNWGYNPYHYNVPEGRYVSTEYEDGTQAVFELRTLIAKLHEAGIAVNMDVVYNHTSGTKGGSLYDSTVPYYFYRFDSDGNYSNGSGCGNEIDSEAPMAKKYIIDSLKHWMLDYHFNGFRFDLMGCLSKETMKEIYDELSKIDPNVMVYGEPWTGGTAAVENGAVQAVASGRMGAGAFDDDFRDAIKGAEFGGFKQGQVQGTFNDSGIINGLVGKSGKNNRNTTGNPGLALRYVECHDNYTLFDKLAISYWMRKNNKEEATTGDLFKKIGEAGLAEVKAEDMLSAAYVMLSQGTAFINGGQEFLRTKRGNENSYNKSNNATYSTNGIDLSFKETYSDVYNTYKGLIALRKANSSAFGSNAGAKAETVSSGVTKYTAGDFCVYFNATGDAVQIDASGYAKSVDVSSGTPTEGDAVSSVPAKSFVILKK